MKIHLNEWVQELLFVGTLALFSFLFFPVEGLICWPITILYLYFVYKIVKLLVKSLVIFYSKRQFFAMILLLLVNIACVIVCYLFPLTILGTPFQYINREESIEKGLFLGDYYLVDSPLPASIFENHYSAWVQYSCFYANYSEKLRDNLVINKEFYDMCMYFTDLRDLIPYGYCQQWKLRRSNDRQYNNYYHFSCEKVVQDSITLPVYDMNDSCIGKLIFVKLEPHIDSLVGTGYCPTRQNSDK